MLSICITFNFPKHFCVVRKLQHLACYVIIQIIDIYIQNKIGHYTDPCGTPLKTDFQFETSPLTTTLCLLSISHFSIQLIIPFPLPLLLLDRSQQFLRSSLFAHLMKTMNHVTQRIQLVSK